MTTIKQIKILGIAGALGVLAFSSQAQPYYLAGDFQGANWDPGANQMTAVGDHYDYTITGQTAGAYAGCQVTDGTWNNKWPGNNIVVRYDATGSATVHFWPGTPGDGWLPLSNRVGYDDPGNLDSWGMAGNFDGWNGTQAVLASVGNGVYSNSIVVATAQTSGFKFQSPAGSWGNIYFGSDFGNNGADGSFTTTNSPQTLPVVLDLPNGRYLVGELAPPPVTNQVVFAVNMTVQGLINKFNPATDGVFASGSFNGWPGTGAGALVLTNDPAWGGNTNIYYATNTIIALPNTSYEYKFTCNDPNTGNGGYEPINQNRTFSLLSSNGIIVLPVVVFGNANLSDYLTEDTTVTFTVDMNGATTSTNSPSNINSPAGMNAPYSFNPNSDYVVINGNFLNGGWISTWDPPSLFGNAMTETFSGSQIYQFTYTVPKGNPVDIHYKYGIIYGSNPSTNSILDNEAPSGQDHIRYIRVTSTGSYTNATDTFGNQYVEPSFGQLAMSPASGGMVNLTWLGRPGVYVQTTTNLTGASWVNHIETDGTNWTAGYSSTNGFVSQTNWPAGGGQQFFRLIQGW